MSERFAEIALIQFGRDSLGVCPRDSTDSGSSEVLRVWHLYSHILVGATCCGCFVVGFQHPLTSEVVDRVGHQTRLTDSLATVTLFVQLISWLVAFYSFLFFGVPRMSRVVTALKAKPFRFRIARTTFRDVRVHLVLGLVLPVVAMSFHGSGSIQQSPRNVRGWLVVVGFALGHCMSFLLDAQLVALMAVLRLSLAALNERLQQLMQRGPWAPPAEATRFRWSDDREVHLRVVELGDLLGRAYGLPLLVSVLTACLQTSCLGFTIVRYVRESEYVLVMGFSILLFAMILRILRVAIACESAYEEERRVARCLNRIGNRDKFTNRDHFELQAFSMQLCHNNLKLTACGFFTINFSFLTKMAATVLLGTAIIELANRKEEIHNTL